MSTAKSIICFFFEHNLPKPSAAGTLEPLAYTRASLSEFCYPILDLTSQISSYPRVAVFQKQLSN